MTPERWRRLEDVVDCVLAAPTTERAGVLADACGGDADLLREASTMLSDDADLFLRETIAAAVTELGGGMIGTVLGAYRLVAELGQGGMGVVYLAERADDQYAARVAIKILHHEMASPAVIARFRDERQILAGLAHPGIVRLLDGGTTEGGLPYLVMEYVPGAPLAAAVRGAPLRERVALMMRVADAVQYAHGKLIVHRDLKPSNIVVDDHGAPKLLDFGIAKLLEPEASQREVQTRTGVAIMTPEYASPEQARGEPVTVATDVYSLGAVLYEVLAGRPPIRPGTDLLATLKQICETEPERPSTVAPADQRAALAGDLDSIVLKALHKRPEDRYASVRELVDDLERYASGRPVAAREATPWYRARKYVARNRGKLAIAAAVIGALATAAIVSIVQASRADAEARRAEQAMHAMLLDHGWQELRDGHATRALPYLSGVLGTEADTPALRFLLARAERPLENQLASIRFERGSFAVAWARDGRFAVVGFDGVRVFDRDGRLLRAIESPPGRLGNPAFAPDGERVAATDQIGGHVFVWDARTGRLVVELPGHRRQTEDAVKTLRFSRDGRHLLSAGEDGVVREWDLAAGEGRVVVARPTAAIAIYDARGRIVVGGAALSVFDGGVVVAGLPEPTQAAVALRDGRIATVHGRSIRIWDASLRSSTVLSGHGGGIFSIEVAPDDRHLASASDDRTARIWDLEAGTFVELLGHTGPVWHAVFSPDGAHVVTTGRDGTHRVWDARTGAVEQVIDASPITGAAPRAWVGAIDAQFSPDGTRLVVVSGGDARVVRVDRGDLLDQLRVDRSVYAAVQSPGDERLLAIAGDHTAEIWDPRRRTRVAVLDVPALLWDINWSPTGAQLVVAGATQRGGAAVARSFTADGRPAVTFAGHTGTVYRAAFDPGGTRLATAGEDHTVRIWDAASGAQVRALDHPDRVMAAAWSHDGTRIATTCWNHGVRVWEATTGELLVTIAGDQQFLDVTFAPHDDALAASRRAGQLAVYELPSGRERFVVGGHTGAVTMAAWSPDGALIATAADDHTVRIWDPLTGRGLATWTHGAGVLSLTWRGHGTSVLAASQDGDIRTWDTRRDDRDPAAIAAWVAEHAPYRIVEGRLEAVDR